MTDKVLVCTRCRTTDVSVEVRAYWHMNDQKFYADIPELPADQHGRCFACDDDDALLEWEHLT